MILNGDGGLKPVEKIEWPPYGWPDM